MSFRARMAVAFTVLVGAILGLFGFLVHAHSERLRAEEFFDRLTDRALLVEALIDEAQSMTSGEAEHISEALSDALPDEGILVLGPDGRVLFKRSAGGLAIPESWRRLASSAGTARFADGDHQYVVIDRPESLTRNGIKYTLAAAADKQGHTAMAELRRSMLITGFIAVLATAGLAWLYATWALVPVRLLVRKAEEVQEPSQRIPAPPGRKGDELSSIASIINRLLDRIEGAFDQQRSFIANVSHELRTPLTVLRGEVHQAIGSGEAWSHLNAIEEQAMHMQDLLEQLLWLAQVRTAGDHASTTLVRVDDVAERAMDRCRARYPSRPLRFNIEQDEAGREPSVMGNAVLITAALYNLLTNAAKYGGAGPVELRISIRNSEVLAAVIDSGPGIASKEISRVRAPFVRTGNAIAHDGHGIGLALVDRIMQVHGGAFNLLSREGEGTTATLRLPLVDG